MDDKKRDKIEIYVFIGFVALIIFLGYDGLITKDAIEGRSGSKVKLMKGIIRLIWETGESHPWVYWCFRGIFLFIALVALYKIIKVLVVKKSNNTKK